ncbi:MAG: hypothetical protein WBM50_24510 [Acidimicrobiales bacterium]
MSQSRRLPERLLVLWMLLAWLVVSCGESEEATTADESSTATVSGPVAESTSTIGSPSTDQSTTTGAATTATAACSASDEQIPPAQDDLPSSVAALRSEILTAAIACDFHKLNELAVAGNVPFRHTDVLADEYQNMTPGEFWESSEAHGTEILAFLVHDLSQPFEIEQYEKLGVVYVWRDPTVCWTVEELFLCRLVEITEAGDWISFYSETP